MPTRSGAGPCSRRVKNVNPDWIEALPFDLFGTVLGLGRQPRPANRRVHADAEASGYPASLFFGRIGVREKDARRQERSKDESIQRFEPEVFFSRIQRFRHTRPGKAFLHQYNSTFLGHPFLGGVGGDRASRSAIMAEFLSNRANHR